MQKTVFDYITKADGSSAIDDERAQLAEVYKRNGKAHSNDAEVDADILANFVGTKLLTDENAIRYVVGYKRSFGVWMREQITRLKAAFGSKNAKTQAFLDKAARLYHAALAESKNAGREVNGGKKSDIQYSIDEIQGEKEDYGQGVILDTELFKGISPRNWGKTLRDYFYKNLAGKEFTAYDEDGRSEVIHLARKNDRVQKDGAANNHRVADKLARYSGDNIRSLTTVHIPEAIEVSRYKSSSDDHSHQWLDSEGWEYRTVYLQDRDGKIYEAELNIAHGNDRLILYDITNIKQIDKKRKAPEGVVGSSGRINTAGDLAHYPDASDSIIADESENVNSSSKKSFSVSEADEFDESIMDTDVNAETLRELKQEAERKASSEYDKLLQEEYNKRQVLYNPDEGKSVKREDLKKVDKEYLERTERQLMNRLAQRMDYAKNKENRLNSGFPVWWSIGDLNP